MSLSRLAALEAESPAPAQTLKQVTILFLDVVGSTALSLPLDPEETHAVMDDALERGSAVVASHHGKILKYAGDSLLAVFGGEQAQEDANISEHGEIVKAWMNRQAVAH